MKLIINNLFILLFSVLILQSCSKKEVPVGSLLSDFPKSAIDSKASIQLTFKEKIGRKGDDASKLIKLTPKAKVSATWISDHSIEVKPVTSYKIGQIYKLKVLGRKIKTKNVEFELKIRELGLNLDFNDPVFSKNGKTLIINGRLTLSDQVDFDQSSFLKASQDGNQLSIDWKSSPSKRIFDIKVSNILRKDRDSKVSLSWNLKNLGLSEKNGVRDFNIEAFDFFKVKDISQKNSNNYIEILFNDPVASEQDLKSYIRSENNPLRFSVEQNLVKAFFVKDIPESYTVKIETGLKSIRNDKIKEPFTKTIQTKTEKPGIRFTKSGAILPDSKDLSIPFEAANIDSFQVTAFSISEEKIPQFLQVNNWTENEQMNRVGRYLWRKTIKLKSEVKNNRTWRKYHLNLDELIKKAPKNLYRIELSINRSNSTYEECEAYTSNTSIKKEAPLSSANSLNDKEASGWDGVESYYSYGNDDYTNRKNPCTDAYYVGSYKNKNVYSKKNILRSNLGLIINKDQLGNHFISTTNILTSQPVSGAKVNFFNFQGQKISSVLTDQDGLAKVRFNETAFYAFAKKDDDQTYIKIDRGSSLATSHFDVGGGKFEAGVQGQIFLDRGVWRPGDEIHAVFVLHDPNKKIPNEHPVTFELFDPKGQLIDSKTGDNVYPMFYAKLKTKESSLTGVYSLKAILGNKIFKSSVLIETVKPNRLKVNLGLLKKNLKKGSNSFKLSSIWLHGSKASKLKFSVNASLKETPPKFTSFTDYKFTDDTRAFSGDDLEVSRGTLDENGNYEGPLEIDFDKSPAGAVNVKFDTKVYENSGDYSVEFSTALLHPYESYIGLRTPKGDSSRNMLLTDQDHKLNIATVDTNGKPLSNIPVEVSFYKINWRWWWEKGNESLANITEAQNSKEISKGRVISDKGLAEFKFKIKYPDWGRYILRACHNINGGHCSTKIVYLDWPGWAGRANALKGPGATRLNLSLEKEEVKVGENVKIYIPKTKQGRALVSISRGDKILSQYWKSLNGGNDYIEFKATEEMFPNVYTSISLIQALKNKKTDKPIRLYGILPVKITNNKVNLFPELKAPVEIKPKESFKISVKEKNGSPMTFSLAIVDEGLLGLTKYKSPDLKSLFYKKQAYGVLSWDLFDDVIGGYAGNLERLVAIGGDGPGKMQQEVSKKKRRFEPVVRFYGPFKLKARSSKKIEVNLPNYLGSVRAMVVAVNNGKYGKQEKEILVKDKLMVLPSLPRVLSPGDEFKAPITVYSLDKKIKSVDVKAKATKGVSIAKGFNLDFNKTGEKIGFTSLKVGNEVSDNINIDFIASSNKFKSQQSLNLKIRTPNPSETRIKNLKISKGESVNLDFKTFGVKGTNELNLQASLLPDLNLNKHIHYLIKYPHGCAEQTISKAFPQLALNKIYKTNKEQQTKIKNNVQTAIEKLSSLQSFSGSFSYWPGTNYYSNWVDAYAGHFIIKAESAGFAVPTSLKEKLIENLKLKTNRWSEGDNKSSEVQSYRLFVLALFNQPDFSAMNRLKSRSSLNNLSKWFLAGAYAATNNEQAAQDIYTNAEYDFKDYVDSSRNFGSKLRDLGVSLLVSSMVNNPKSSKIFKSLKKSLDENTYNTQGLSFALISLSEYFSNFKSKGFKFSYNLNGSKETLNPKTPFSIKKISLYSRDNTLKITNNSNSDLYVQRNIIGSPLPGNEEQSDALVSKSRSLGLDMTLTDKNQAVISSFKQGEDFIANLEVKNQSQRDLKNLALSFLTPSGVEIFDSNYKNSKNIFQYQDVRDDRIYTYLDIKKGETKKIKFLLHSSFSGKFYFPSTRVEAMYNPKIYNQVNGKWIEIKNL